jgi:hypothetical protein
MSTDAQATANRKNARRSTGPKTPEGKACSSQNARKHGLYARPPVTAGEAASEYREWASEWHDHYQPDGPAETLLIARAAHAGWRLNRCAHVEAAQLAKKIRHAAARFARDEQERAEALGRRLLASGLAPFRQRRQLPPDTVPENPAALQRELSAFAEGADWLISRWRALLGTLDAEGKWDDHDRFQAIALLGKVTENALDDDELTALIVASHTTVQPIWDLWGDFARACGLGQDKPLYHARIDALIGTRQTDPTAARAFLRGLAERELERLATLKTQHLEPLATIDRAEAADRAAFDDTREGAALRRYESACARDLHTALRDLTRLQSQPSRRNEPDAEPVILIEVMDDDASNFEPVPAAVTVPETAVVAATPPQPPIPPSPPKTEAPTPALGGLERLDFRPSAVTLPRSPSPFPVRRGRMVNDGPLS